MSIKEAIAGLVIGILTVLLGVVRRRRLHSNAPPPPSDFCEKCFFFREFKREISEQRRKEREKNVSKHQ